MRAVSLVVAVLLAASFLALPSHAQVESVGHLSVPHGTINATQTLRYKLDPEEGLRTGFVFGVYGGVTGGAPRMLVTLSYSGRPVANWTWEGIGFHFNTTRLANSGPHELTLTNPSTSQGSNFAFYYDMSCACVGKVVPLPGGYNLFFYDFPPDRKARIDVPLTSNATIKGTIAVARGLDAKWPQDFEAVVERTETGPGSLDFAFHTPSKSRYYLFLEAKTGASPTSPVAFEPDGSVDPVESPGLAFAGWLGAVVAALRLRRR